MSDSDKAAYWHLSWESMRKHRDELLETITHQHHVTCNHSHGPIGGPGCVCVVVNKHLNAEKDKQIQELDALLDREQQASYKDFLAMRGVEKPCSACSGVGLYTYGNTSTWRGGIGGQAMTLGICDKCWGSGDADHPWTNLREIAALTAERDKLREMLTIPEHSEQMFDRLLDRIVDAEGKLAYIKRHWDAITEPPRDETQPQERLALDLCLTQVFHMPETIPPQPAEQKEAQ